MMKQSRSKKWKFIPVGGIRWYWWLAIRACWARPLSWQHHPARCCSRRATNIHAVHVYEQPHKNWFSRWCSAAKWCNISISVLVIHFSLPTRVEWYAVQVKCSSSRNSQRILNQLLTTVFHCLLASRRGFGIVRSNDHLIWTQYVSRIVQDWCCSCQIGVPTLHVLHLRVARSCFKQRAQ